MSRAEAMVVRLPISIRIEGPKVNWDSHPQRRWRGFGPRSGDWLTRSTADGHRVSFGLGTLPWQREPHGIGWITLALLLGLIVLAYVYVRRLLRPLDDIRAGAERFGRGAFDQPIRCAGATSWATWRSASTPWRTTSRPCSMPSARCCWR